MITGNFVIMHNLKHKKLSKSTIVRTSEIWYHTYIRVKYAYSTYSRYALLNLRRINPSDSRCGSVETCRNSASVSLRCGENAREMVGAFRVATQWQV